MEKTVVVGMSGGVDSSVAAALLKEQGYNVIGVTMELWGEGASDDAAAVCEVLKIPHHTLDFREKFKASVVDYFCDSYLSGHTPNPCIVCNRRIKFEELLERAGALGAGYIATGHYARIDTLPNGRYAVRASVTREKDQTYALYQLTQEQLSHTLFPLGDYSKDEIRALAERYKLPVAKKHDSQDICFIPDGDYGAFLNKQVPSLMPGPGSYVWKDGTAVGTHKGYPHYTIGQRKGLEIAMGRRIFVTGIDLLKNEVYLGDNDDLFSRELTATDICFMGAEGLSDGQRLWGKIRYSHKGDYCSVHPTADGNLKVIFDEPMRAITPGQALVLYDGEYIVAGGTIS